MSKRTAKKRSQVFFLDLLVALSLIIFVFLLYTKAFEATTFSANSNYLFNTMRKETMLANFLTIAENKCSVVSTSNTELYKTIACVNLGSFSLMSSFPSENYLNYDINIYDATSGSLNVLDSKSFYQTTARKSNILTREINILYSNNGNVSKKNIHDCLFKNSCNIKKALIRVRVVS